MTLDSLLGGAQKLLNTGASAYQTVANLKEGPAPVAPAPVSQPGTFAPPSAAPWYKAKWVMPAAAVLGGLLLIITLRRRK